MNPHKGCNFLLLIVVLTVLVGTIIFAMARQREEKTHAAYYSDVLAQAPCIESVCPGFDQGLVSALERLASSDLVQGNEQGRTRIGLSFNYDNAGLGYGIIEFTGDSEVVQKTVDHISIVLHELKLKTVVSALGNPDEFLFISGCGLGRRVRAEMYYLATGVKVTSDYRTRRPDSQILTGSTPIEAIIYFEPDDLQDRILASLESFIEPSNVRYDFHPSVTTDDIVTYIRPWPGLEASPTPSADFCPR